jgi:D-arabinose 1-dehydrogenase-like Zn-dependent alcohol dehydrogenase
VYAAIKKAGLGEGEWVAFPGAGSGLGHLGVQIARKMGYPLDRQELASASRDNEPIKHMSFACILLCSCQN